MATGHAVHKCPENGCHDAACPADDNHCFEAGPPSWCIQRCNPDYREIGEPETRVLRQVVEVILDFGRSYRRWATTIRAAAMGRAHR